jgi:hypothetical protein
VVVAHTHQHRHSKPDPTHFISCASATLDGKFLFPFFSSGSSSFCFSVDLDGGLWVFDIFIMLGWSGDVTTRN